MPLYQYREGNKVVERVLPVEERDSFAGRVTVPESVTIPGSAPDRTGLNGVPDALRGIEDKGELRQLTEEGGFSTEELKEVWGEELQARF